MWQSTENNEENVKNELISTEILILNLVSTHAKCYSYVVSYQKDVFEASIPLTTLKKFGRNQLQFGTVLVGSIALNAAKKEIAVKSVKLIYLLPKAVGNKWTQLKLEFSDSLKKHVISCSALTSGCFTYLDQEFKSPAIFNDVLGIIVDSEDDPQLPKREIGRLICTVTTVQCPSDGCWKLRIESIKNFDKILSPAMSARVAENEHFGVVTREECEPKRDLRLVSSRDFPRDVRIFRSRSHCCEVIESGVRRQHDHHSQCINTCVGEVSLIGQSMAFRMKRCHGMSALQPIHLDTSMGSQLSIAPPTSSEGHHVDSGSMRRDVSQLEVNVQAGFVEVTTVAEYHGYTDHNGQPLLWSHDVEFVVDMTKIFHEQNLACGLYQIKVVRFHRQNVFAKWRLARKNPIVNAMRTRFHSQGPHSISLATIGLDALALDDEALEEAQEPRQRLPSFSRFGNSSQSCCIPRTDSLDNVELFDALVQNELSTKNAPLTKNSKINAACGVKVTEVDDDSMWMHHNHSVLKIVEEDEDSKVEDYDENSNVF